MMKNNLTFLLIIFIGSLLIRLWVTHISPKNDRWTDLLIYVSGGQLVTNQVNPYNYQDNIVLRDSLRKGTSAIDPWLGETQERWDYYTSGNLPLSLLSYGAIEFFAKGNPSFYRVTFCILDSILAVYITLFILHFWQVSNKIKILLAIFLGMVSPILLYQGTLYPEDKGVQILFMIAALYHSKRKNFLLASFFLGWAVAFKGLGIFIAPLCLYYLLDSPTSFIQAMKKPMVLRAVQFTMASLFFALLPFLPYLEGVFTMMTGRLENNLNATPMHSAIWRVPYFWSPENWQVYKLAFTLVFLGINILLVIIKRITPEILTASLLLWFLGIVLLAGSLDRMNIAFLTIILILGMTSVNAAMLLASAYMFIGGVLFLAAFATLNSWSMLEYELLDSFFSLIFTITYTTILIYFVFKKQSRKLERSS